jgi:hypothetical protein
MTIACPRLPLIAHAIIHMDGRYFRVLHSHFFFSNYKYLIDNTSYYYVTISEYLRALNHFFFGSNIQRRYALYEV